MTAANKVVFLLDVDNTLLDNDRIVADLGEQAIERIGDLLEHDLPALLEHATGVDRKQETT